MLDDVKLTELSTAVLSERMWHCRGSKHSLTHPTYFPQPQDLCLWLPLSFAPLLA